MRGTSHVPLTFLVFPKSALPKLLVRIGNESPSPSPAWRIIYAKLGSEPRGPGFCVKVNASLEVWKPVEKAGGSPPYGSSWHPVEVRPVPRCP